jgi:LytS/YehU family sensor histidine kinase
MTSRGAHPSRSAKRIVASYDSYPQVQRVVDALADQRFPVEGLAIVGAGLESVEQVTGRRGFGRAAGEGAVSGAVVGALVGWLMGLFSIVVPTTTPALVALWSAVLGAVVGALIGLVVGFVGKAAERGSRDFSSVTAVRAQRYDLLALDEIAIDAERAIAEIDADRTGTGR